MIPFSEACPGAFEPVDLVLTDFDDTLTLDGRLHAATYAAIERLDDAGVRVVPITAASAGWCDQMIHTWPIAAIIGENGGFCFTHRGGEIARRFWLDTTTRVDAFAQLAEAAEGIQTAIRGVALADDQPFRLTSLAFKRPDSDEAARHLADALELAGARTTINSIWVLGWFGAYDKIAAAKRFLPDAVGFDIARDSDRAVFVGDSANDAPMFATIPKSIGVSTVRRHLADLPKPPMWVTRGPGGAGFVEVADAILAARAARRAPNDARRRAETSRA